MRDLYKFICTHSLAVVCGETSDRNPNEPKLQAVKITDGKRSDTMSAALTESEIRKVVDFLADCTIIGYGAPLNFFRKLCSQYNIQYSYPTIDIAEFAHAAAARRCRLPHPRLVGFLKSPDNSRGFTFYTEDIKFTYKDPHRSGGSRYSSCL